MMTNAELIDGFVSLFRGRGDCYGSESGGCVRERLTTDVFASHLTDGPSIGVYPAVPMDPQAICVWGCSDIDVEDLGAARLMQRTLNAGGVNAWVERSRSKGYHVWVFCSDPVPAEDMRRMLLVAHQVADYPAREVNPKQSDVSVSKVGNYVRLPYPGGLLRTPVRRVVLDDTDSPISLADFIADVSAKRCTPEDVSRISAMYVAPPKSTIVIDFESDESLDDALRRASPLARVIWKQGPIASQDRSTALVRLAHVCRESGITPSMCAVIVIDADKRWGKFHVRGEHGIAEIHKIIEKVYRKIQ